MMKKVHESYSWLLLLLVVAIVASSLTTAYPTRLRARRSPRRHNYPSISYMYPISRPGLCANNDVYYTDCYLCGKISDSSAIYSACCQNDGNVYEFCVSMLS